MRCAADAAIPVLIHNNNYQGSIIIWSITRGKSKRTFCGKEYAPLRFLKSENYLLCISPAGRKSSQKSLQNYSLCLKISAKTYNTQCLNTIFNIVVNWAVWPFNVHNYERDDSEFTMEISKKVGCFHFMTPWHPDNLMNIIACLTNLTLILTLTLNWLDRQRIFIRVSGGQKEEKTNESYILSPTTIIISSTVVMDVINSPFWSKLKLKLNNFEVFLVGILHSVEYSDNM